MVAVLDGIRVSWEWLCTEPYPVTVDGSRIAGVADREIPLGELRALLLDRSTGRPVRDAVWAHLIGRSRQEGATWTVACAGMALPMLAGAYRECVARVGGDGEEIASAVVTGFLAELAAIDPGRPGLASALRWAALRAGLRTGRVTNSTTALLPDEAAAEVAGESAGSVEGHPDLVLAGAVAAGVLSYAEADLIGETRLQRVPLHVYATRHGVSVGAMTMRRLRAEARLAEHLHAPATRTSDRSRVISAPRTIAPAAPSSTAPGCDGSDTAEPVGASISTDRPALSSSPSVLDVAGSTTPDAPESRSSTSKRSAMESLSVTGRCRRRTRGARRPGPGQAQR
ncbi:MULTISPECIES: hypothetical protein [Pseudonocardia]|uniref:hypothetical protein n=1 Tax=Pseudonocardia TaxID=1847 RepID=UPI000A2831BE|nr:MULTISPECIES: hypothetical protein [Pseudonocardia]